jgi:putative NADPH-quinone reductase
MKKIFILLGHPDKDGTISNEFANAYEEAAKAAGHEVRRTNLGELQFDPILHKGYRAIQELEPDLKKIQEDIRWCEHFVLVYPLWWSGTPALLKGMVDRMWLPGFGFRFKKMNGTKRLIGWEKLLKGRTSRVIVSSKNFPILEEFMYGDYTGDIVNAVLRFSGFKVRISKVGDSESLSDGQKKTWLKKFAAFGKKGQ